MWQTIKNRLNSPVVIGQLIINGLALFYFILTTWAKIEITGWDTFVLIVITLYNILAGVNNPADKSGF